MSVNQRARSVLDADDIESGVTERFGANGSVLFSSGFRAMSFRRRPFDRRAQVTHRVLQLRSCHALSC